MSQYAPSGALFTDLYQLTMAQAYLRSGQTDVATFSLFVRNLPSNRGYLLFAGLENLIDYLENLRFTDEDINYLRSTKQFGEDFIEYLSGFNFAGNVRAMDEGTPFFANEPVVEVTAPVIQGQIVETYLLNQVNMQSLFTSKAARIVHAAGGADVVDFASRRAHGTDAANKFARASYIGGFAGTSNVRAGALYGLPTIGTMAHAFITSFNSEIDAFRAYAEAFPDTTTLLVDTYDTLKGVDAAITVAHELESKGHRLVGVRLDSGDLSKLASITRGMLDDAGLPFVQIVASGGLDEFSIDSLVKNGAPINAYGVGTKAGVSADAPWSDAVYKQVAYSGNYVAKLGMGKATLPGPKQVWRCYKKDDHKILHDHLTSADAQPPESNATPLLREMLRNGNRLGSAPSLESVRERVRYEISRLPESTRNLSGPDTVSAVVSDGLTSWRPKP